MTTLVTRRTPLVWLLVLFLGLPVAFFSAAFRHTANGFELGPYDLWRVVRYICVPAAGFGVPFPCSSVHPETANSPGYVILPVTGDHILTVPTRRIIGIEDPAAQSPESAIYWQAAWDARLQLRTDHGTATDRSRFALAINSAYARSQEQFHIHTACVQPDVKAILADESDRIGFDWTPLQTRIKGWRFTARKLDATDLKDVNVIALLPADVRANRTVLSKQTLVVVGTTLETGRPGFYVLNSESRRGDGGQGEALLDFNCLSDK